MKMLAFTTSGMLILGGISCYGGSENLDAGHCLIEESNPLTVLRPSESDHRVSPGMMLVMDSRGSYYTPSSTDGIVIKWDYNGAFDTILGQPGSGPGEFAPGPVSVFVDSNDSIYVRDGAFRWNVFTPDLRVARQSFIGPIAAIRPEATHILDDGTIVSS